MREELSRQRLLRVSIIPERTNEPSFSLQSIHVSSWELPLRQVPARTLLSLRGPLGVTGHVFCVDRTHPEVSRMKSLPQLTSYSMAQFALSNSERGKAWLVMAHLLHTYLYFYRFSPARLWRRSPFFALLESHLPLKKRALLPKSNSIFVHFIRIISFNFCMQCRLSS